MTRLGLMVITMILGLTTATWADYLIKAKNGREFTTDRYWEEAGEIKFNFAGGVFGIPKDLILSIEDQGPDNADKNPAETEEAQTVPGPKPGETETTQEETDKKEENSRLKSLIEKKNVLKKKLDEALARLRTASKNKDRAAKDKARQEMRGYATQLYALTNQVKALNNGELPDGWWDD